MTELGMRHSEWGAERTKERSRVVPIKEGSCGEETPARTVASRGQSPAQ